MGNTDFWLFCDRPPGPEPGPAPSDSSDLAMTISLSIVSTMLVCFVVVSLCYWRTRSARRRQYMNMDRSSGRYQRGERSAVEMSNIISNPNVRVDVTNGGDQPPLDLGEPGKVCHVDVHAQKVSYHSKVKEATKEPRDLLGAITKKLKKATGPKSTDDKQPLLDNEMPQDYTTCDDDEIRKSSEGGIGNQAFDQDGAPDAIYNYEMYKKAVSKAISEIGSPNGAGKNSFPYLVLDKSSCPTSTNHFQTDMKTYDNHSKTDRKTDDAGARSNSDDESDFVTHHKKKGYTQIKSSTSKKKNFIV